MLNWIKSQGSPEARLWHQVGEIYASKLYDSLNSSDPLSRVILSQMVISSTVIVKGLVYRSTTPGSILSKDLSSLEPHEIRSLLNYHIWVLVAIFARSLRKSVPQIGYAGLVTEGNAVIPLTLRDKDIVQRILDQPVLDITQLSEQCCADIKAITDTNNLDILARVEWEALVVATYKDAHAQIEKDIQALSASKTT